MTIISTNNIDNHQTIDVLTLYKNAHDLGTVPTVRWVKEKNGWAIYDVGQVVYATPDQRPYIFASVAEADGSLRGNGIAKYYVDAT